MSIFNNQDFFPTPKSVIEKMVKDINLFDQVIIDPSSGKGDIIDFVKERGAKEVLACEIDKELAVISAQKADRFLCNDFLELTSIDVSHIDLFLMNPPFSADETHILHAWDICPDGCTIVSLCNWEVIRNTHTNKKRQLSQIINQYGECDNLGRAFLNGERTTDVEVGMIILKKPKNEEKDEFEDYFDLDEEFQHQENGLITYDVVWEIVNRYVGAVKMFDEVTELSNKINSLAEPFSYCSITFGAYNKQNNYQTITRDVYKKELQKAAWRKLFSMMNMEKYITHKVKEQINKFVEQQQNVPFTRKNIYLMIHLIAGTQKDRMKSVIVEVFDWLTQYHHENRYQKEGWKTNSEYRVNKKFIAPYSRVSSGWHGEPEIKWSSSGHHIDDLVKAICFIVGENYDKVEITINNKGEKVKQRTFIGIEDLYKTKEVTNEDAKYIAELLHKTISDLPIDTCSYLHEYCHNVQYNDRNLKELCYRINIEKYFDSIKQFYIDQNLSSKYFGKRYEYKEFGKWYDFNFFRVKVFKKGTLHAEFKDEKIWERFNQVACEAKGFQLASKYSSDFKKKTNKVEIYEQK